MNEMDDCRIKGFCLRHDFREICNIAADFIRRTKANYEINGFGHETFWIQVLWVMCSNAGLGLKPILQSLLCIFPSPFQPLSCPLMLQVL